jgi:hypothetical protein
VLDELRARRTGLPHTESARADADLCCADLAEAGLALLGQEERPRSRRLFDCNTCCQRACVQINRNTYYKLQARAFYCGTIDS